MNTPRTPVDFITAPPYSGDAGFGDASLAESRRQMPTPIERFLRSPAKFWVVESLLFVPVALFLLQGLLHELGQATAAARINGFLFGSSHTLVRDIFGPLVLPAVGIVLALARLRELRRGKDRSATIYVAIAAIGAIGIVLGYALLERVGSFLR